MKEGMAMKAKHIQMVESHCKGSNLGNGSCLVDTSLNCSSSLAVNKTDCRQADSVRSSYYPIGKHLVGFLCMARRMYRRFCNSREREHRQQMPPKCIGQQRILKGNNAYERPPQKRIPEQYKFNHQWKSINSYLGEKLI